MQPERPLLTIAIPTYNRSGYLAQLLSVLAPQLVDEPRVELIVSDNASSDDTQNVIENFQQKGLQLAYIRNEANIGPDANFLQCFEDAKGKYVWLFGDDDVITPGAIKRILALIQDCQYDLVFVAPFVYRGNYVAERQEESKCNPPEEVFESTRFVRMANRHGDLIFLSSLIVNKEVLLQLPHPSFHELLGTNLVQLGWVFTALKHFQRGLIVNEYLVAGLAVNSVGISDAGRVFGQNLYSVATAWLDSKSRLYTVIFNDLLCIWFPRNWLGIRCTKSDEGTKSSDPERLFRSLFGRNFRYWLFAFPLLKMPLPIAKIWSKCLLMPNRIARALSHV